MRHTLRRLIAVGATIFFVLATAPAWATGEGDGGAVTIRDEGMTQ